MDQFLKELSSKYGVEFVETSHGSPVQYSIRKDGKEVGFTHFRYGHFTAFVGPDNEAVPCLNVVLKGDSDLPMDIGKHLYEVAAMLCK